MNDRRARKRTKAAAERERRQQRAAEIAAAAAARAEEIAEEQAPRAQRVAVTGADGAVVREPLAERDEKRGGFVRSNSLWQMQRQSSITGEQFVAARRYALDYEVGILGANPAGRTGEFVDGARAAEISQSRLDAVQRYREASDAMGARRQIVQWLAIHDAPDNHWTVGRAAVVLGVRRDVASGWLKEGLDALARHYWPQSGAPSSARGAAVVDAGVTDIPQERLGRVAA